MSEQKTGEMRGNDAVNSDAREEKESPLVLTGGLDDRSWDA